MSEEDDWLERALREGDEETDAGDGESDRAADVEDATAEDDRNEVADVETEREAITDADADSADPFGGVRHEDDRTGWEGDGLEGADFGDIDDFEDGDFENDFPGSDAFGGGSFGDDDPFSGGSAGDDDPFGGSPDDSGDPFGGYRGTSPAPDDEFGFGDFGGNSGGSGGGGGGGSGGGATEYDVDPDEIDSAIDRTDIGIEGLDEMIRGGVPRRSLLSVIGGAGTGKTTFALQFLNEALDAGRKGVYITLEQTRESILSTAEEKGWSFREHVEADRLAVVAIDPIEMANSLASIRNDLTRLIAEFDADRLVLDSVSLLEMMYDHPSKRRSEVFGFTRSLKEAGVTTLLTSEANERNPYASRHGIVEYLTDAVFVLQYIRGSDFRETRLAVEIQKIRDANHSRETKPYEITDTGISVYGQANIF
ncbi:circadian clock protein, KaiC [Halorubrum aidingense JCM 13560]|uniref:Circadian clock protein, KaiC n=1 Tax=Halorubrum aidingense JCM 13560 TaxID=1230454 RepID=M0PFA0_9EURY|nr:KaiC domain-containing protein [Halorubrum aidingense]EMA67460.1 circadian clock protein, KaiC [Halorubrum aidingense JCM 13560]